MKLTIGFSPCPNDTFIFDALVNGKIDTEGLEFEPVLEDVQTLNGWALQGKLDITKLSFPALFATAETYQILDAGAALGEGVGPLLISKKMIAESQVSNCKIAIPGEGTTANFLLHYAFPEVKTTVPTLFSEIEDAVLREEVDMGVIIHENRFTYQQKGLHKICDLGEVWESREGVPIPLGCIAAKKSFPDDLVAKITSLIKKSLQFSWDSYPQLSSYVTENAQAMEESVMRKHIELYVNNYTESLGNEGQKAVQKFEEVFRQYHSRNSSVA